MHNTTTTTNKKIIHQEAAYLLGLLALAFGTALMERADFGMSMVVAPAYLIHLKVSQYFSWFSFGVSEYCLQALLLILTSLILRSFQVRYLFSFVTAVIYGIILDVWMKFVSFFGIPGSDTMAIRIILYTAGLLFCAFGVALLFHTYLEPEAYEVLVRDISGLLNKDIGKVKTIYDCCSCAIAVLLSFLFFGIGHFEGVKAGTILCALINGTIIGWFSHYLDSSFDFKRFSVLPATTKKDSLPQ